MTSRPKCKWLWSLFLRLGVVLGAEHVEGMAQIHGSSPLPNPG
jgi:hypothetical protein